MKEVATLFLKELNKNGYPTYFVGGSVREKLRRDKPADYDLTTKATPEQTEEVLKNIANNISLVGAKFGVTIADGIEIAMFRTETYVTKGKPDVKPAQSLYEDVSRRDFTINAMAEDEYGNIIDYFNGQEDIKRKLIRAVGNPDQRFKEDPSRILRGLYLAARLEYRIEDETLESMIKNSRLLSEVPEEAKGKILEKVISYNKLHLFLKFLRDTGLLEYVIPELVHTINSPQNPKYHYLDVFGHIVEVVKAAELKYPNDRLLVYSALLHDNAKGKDGIRGVNTLGQPNDIGHESGGVKPAKNLLLRLNLGKYFANEVAFIVKHHGLRLTDNPKETTVLRKLRLFSEMAKNKEDLIKKVDVLFKFMDLDADGFNPEFGAEVKKQTISIKNVFDKVLKEYLFFREELPINGKDLILLGFEGKQVGELLSIFIERNMRTKEEINKYLLKKYQVKLPLN